MRRVTIALASSAMLACGGSPPQPPVVNPPGGAEMINGSERIGWDQPAADAVELAAIRYAIYVDGTRSELAGVSCAPSTAGARFSCAARLPPLSAGAHALQIASFIIDGSLLESARSGTLNVNVASLSAATTSEPPLRRADSRTSNGSRARVDAVAGALDVPVDIAVTPDGRMFVAERAGRIVVLRDGRANDDGAISLADAIGAGGRVIALALDPQFERTRFVFVLYASTDGFAVARLRESNDTLDHNVVLLDGVAASASAIGALRFGPDGKLYVAFDDGGDPNRAGDAGSFNGKVLRLNIDGTTPADQAGGSPVFAADLIAPAALAWQPSNGALWIADRRDGRSAQLRATAGSPLAAYALPPGTQPTSLIFERANRTGRGDTLLVGSDGAARLLRITIDPRTAGPSDIERLVGDADPIRALAIARDGAVVFAASERISRLTSAR